jgi:hypothetical protein
MGRGILFWFFLAAVAGLSACLVVNLATFVGLNPPYASNLLWVLLAVVVAAGVRFFHGGWKDGREFARDIPWALRVLAGGALIYLVVTLCVTDDRWVEQSDGRFILHGYDGTSAQITRAEYEQQQRYSTRRDSALTMFLFSGAVALLYAGVKRKPDPDSDLAKYPVTTLLSAEAIIFGGLGCFLGFAMLGSLFQRPPYVRPELYDATRVAVVLGWGGKFGLLVTGVLLRRRSWLTVAALVLTFTVSAADSIFEWWHFSDEVWLSERNVMVLFLPPLLYAVGILVLLSPSVRAELNAVAPQGRIQLDPPDLPRTALR